MPYDFYNTFSEVTGEDLSWYWKPWLFEFGYPDLAIKEITVNRTILIEKVGNIPIPIKLTVTFVDGSEKNIYKTARVWEEGNTIYPIPLFREKRIKTIELGDQIIPDVDRSNNIVHID